MEGQVKKDILNFLEGLKFNFALIDDYLEHDNSYLAKQVAYGSLLGASERLTELRQEHYAFESSELKDLKKKLSVSEKLREDEKVKFAEKEKDLQEANKRLQEDLEKVKLEFEQKEEARKRRNRERIKDRFLDLSEQ